MKKLFSVLFISSLLALHSCSERSDENPASVPDKKINITSLMGEQVQPGQLIVKWKREPSATDALTRSSGIHIHKMERVFPHAGKFEERTRAAGLHLWYVVEYDKAVATTRAAEQFSLLDDVLAIEPVISVRKTNTGKFRKLSDSDAAIFEKSSTRSAFTDPYLYAQWHFENTGKINHTLEGADIRLFDAWEFTTGHPDVIVAVVDGGIDYTHEDLAANIWVNLVELNGTENFDDDGNGYKDDIYGYNFVTGKAIEPTIHGTHVAGTLAAVNNNNIGVAGIAGGDGAVNSGIRLMNCQIFLDNEDGERSSTNYYVAAAIKYGADNGAVISQNSWGFDLGTVNATPQIISEAIDYFITKAGTDELGNQIGPMKGGLVVFAAGNDNVRIPTFPASDNNVISVAAMGPDYKRAAYSNYGTTIDIMAPGGEIGYDPGRARTGVLSTGSGWDGSAVVRNAYYYMDGTSMACPHVSGVAALLISKYGVGQPGLTPARLKELLYTSVYDVSGYNSGYKGMLGVGVLDASKALASGVIIADPPILLKALPNLVFTQTGDLRTIALNDYFVPGKAGDELIYRVATTSEAFNINLTGDQLKISAISYSREYITVIATDPQGLKTEATFLVSCYPRTVMPERGRPGFWSGVSDLP